MKKDLYTSKPRYAAQFLVGEQNTLTIARRNEHCVQNTFAQREVSVTGDFDFSLNNDLSSSR